jgi:hypothetical protein
MLVALLLVGSSLGQIAHFLLVPHAICTEHGELLEVSEQAAHDGATRAEDVEGSRAASPEMAAEHEHCQLLARAPRELALPRSPSLGLLPAPSSQRAALIRPLATHAPASQRLLDAPKTSPPVG